MIEIKRLTKQEWEGFSETAHLISFGERRSHAQDRIDFALMAIDAELPLGYLTCRETDEDTIYIAYGGAFPSSKGSALSFRAYEKGISYLADRYQHGFTLIENKNTTMIKLAMKVGFAITGVKVFKGRILLEHTINFPRKD